VKKAILAALLLALLAAGCAGIEIKPASSFPYQLRNPPA